jgi:hypothetical protein
MLYKLKTGTMIMNFYKFRQNIAARIVYLYVESRFILYFTLFLFNFNDLCYIHISTTGFKINEST